MSNEVFYAAQLQNIIGSISCLVLLLILFFSIHEFISSCERENKRYLRQWARGELQGKQETTLEDIPGENGIYRIEG